MKQSVIVFLQTHTSTQFLMVGKSSSMVGYHLMTEGHSIQQGVWGEGVLWAPHYVQDSALVEVRIFFNFFWI